MSQIIEVTVYELPPVDGKIVCRQCDQTKKVMEKHGIPFVKKDAQDPENRAIIAELGYMAAPVVTVTVDGELVQHWYGFRDDLIKDLAYKLK